jgi:uncharacterized protein YndB with AHSA1/START domain
MSFWKTSNRRSKEMDVVANRGTATVTLPTDEQILITREFDAPRHLVYEAFTTPELVGRWWTAKRGEMTTCEIDLRVGGKWRYVMRTPDGMEVGFHGEYREIVPNERIVSTEIFEGMPEGFPEEVAVNTATFTEEDGRTTLTILVEHSSKEFRDGHVDSGMEDGLQDALDLLEEVATSLR